MNNQILIIDDEPEIAEMVQLIIERKTDYRCTYAPSGKTGIQKANECKPDLIVLDMNMPEMDGLQVCSLLKKSAETKNIPIIFITGRTDTQTKLQAFELGAVDYIGKPFDTDEVIARIKTHLNLKHAQEENQKYLEMLYESRYLNGLATMVQGFTHNFNNLMAIISTQVQLLMKCPNSDISEKILQTIDRTYDLINRLHIFAETKESLYQVLYLDEVIDKIIKSFEAGLPEAVKIHIEFQDRLPPIKANLNLLWQMIVNLLTNAYEALNGKGDIKIIGRLETTEISPNQGKDNYVCLEIQDTGKGISTEHLKHIYEPFFTTKRTVGVGLGLSMSYALMKRWQGKIELESKSGHGTTVRLYFKPEYIAKM